MEESCPGASLHAIGSLARPMSDADLEAKFRGLCAPVLATASMDALIREIWHFDSMASAGALARMTVPAGMPGSARPGGARDRAATTEKTG